MQAFFLWNIAMGMSYTLILWIAGTDGMGILFGNLALFICGVQAGKARQGKKRRKYDQLIEVVIIFVTIIASYLAAVTLNEHFPIF